MKREDVKDWIDHWVNLFPIGVKSGGKLVRSDRRMCFKKMSLFVTLYDYDLDTIFKATESYLEDRAEDDFAYTKCAVYFIDKKDEGSSLAEWCEKVLHDQTEISEVDYFV